MLMLKIWHYLSYKGYFYFCVQRKTTRFYWTFTDASGTFRGLPRVVKATSHVSVRQLAKRLPPIQRFTILSKSYHWVYSKHS